MKSIYFIFDNLREEITTTFIRNNDKAAIADTKNAFKEQAKDDTSLKLYKVAIGSDFPYTDDISGIPCNCIWFSDEETEEC